MRDSLQDRTAAIARSRLHSQPGPRRLRLADWHGANHDLHGDAHLSARTGAGHHELQTNKGKGKETLYASGYIHLVPA